MDVGAVYTRENRPQLTLTEAYIRRERNHLYKYGLQKTRNAGINGSRLSSQPDRSNDDVELKIEVFRHFPRTANVKKSRDQCLAVRFVV